MDTQPRTQQHAGFKDHMLRRWPVLVTLLVIGAVYAAISDRLSLGPRWLLIAVVIALIAVLFVAHLQGYHGVAVRLGQGLTVVVTVAIAFSAVFLLTRLPGGQAQAPGLLRDAALIWAANILVFTAWYWEIDGGGPTVRESVRESGGYVSRDLVFPQIQIDERWGDATWRPEFLDYLFFAFNTSTAFSPTDTLVLSRRAKLLMMAQSILSLLVIAVLAARAINTL